MRRKGKLRGREALIEKRVGKRRGGGRERRREHVTRKFMEGKFMKGEGAPGVVYARFSFG